MKPRWRILDTGAQSCRQNIALDKVLLSSNDCNLIPNTMRFFRFTGHSVLLGFYQKAEQEIRCEYCQKQGIQINRRITGGNTVYCDDATIGWEVIIARNDLAAGKQAEILLARIGKALVCSLEKLGVPAEYSNNSNTIEVEGRQIGWIGGTAYANSIFFQGYICGNELNAEKMLHALRIPTEKLKNKELELFKKKYTCLKKILGDKFVFEKVKAALIAGFAEVFVVAVLPGKLTNIEERLYALQMHCDDLFQEEWSGEPKLKQIAQYPQLRSMLKAEAVLSVSLTVANDCRRIKAVSISGDFYAYPLQIIAKLEAKLCNVTAEIEHINKIVHDCFQENRAMIAGIKLDDFSKSISKAAEHMNFIAWGAYPDEVNELVIIGNIFANGFAGNIGTELFRQSTIPLLLPYCAKEISCKFRYEQGCARCGKCDIGEAYELAEEYGMKAITIQNYEMLEEKLISLKASGCRAFIGTCCEAFWVKHYRDFERLGLPGILINVDNSTCYDLGKEQKAYQGNFENKTALKHGLMRRVLHKLWLHAAI